MNLQLCECGHSKSLHYNEGECCAIDISVPEGHLCQCKEFKLKIPLCECGHSKREHKACALLLDPPIYKVECSNCVCQEFKPKGEIKQ